MEPVGDHVTNDPVEAVGVETRLAKGIRIGQPLGMLHHHALIAPEALGDQLGVHGGEVTGRVSSREVLHW